MFLLCFFYINLHVNADAVGDLITKYRQNKADKSPIRIQKKSQKKTRSINEENCLKIVI